MEFYIKRTITGNFETSLLNLTYALDQEGFGVLTEINVTEIFQEKLGKEFQRYLILGACNPEFAYKALQLEEMVGTLLPCNVVIQEKIHGQVEIAAIDPVAMMSNVNNPHLLEFAEEIKTRLQNVLDNCD